MIIYIHHYAHISKLLPRTLIRFIAIVIKAKPVAYIHTGQVIYAYIDGQTGKTEHTINKKQPPYYPNTRYNIITTMYKL